DLIERDGAATREDVGLESALGGVLELERRVVEEAVELRPGLHLVGSELVAIPVEIAAEREIPVELESESAADVEADPLEVVDALVVQAGHPVESASSSEEDEPAILGRDRSRRGQSEGKSAAEKSIDEHCLPPCFRGQ